MLKVCLQCQKEFKTYRTAAIYCGRSCQFASQVRAKTYICAGCGKEFQRSNYRIKDKYKGKEAAMRFCTSECHQKWRRDNQRADIPCAVCGNMFHPKTEAIRHCSKECRDKGLITQVELTCTYCHKAFNTFAGAAKNGRKFCSDECARMWHTGSNHPAYRGGRWLKHGTKWKKIRLKILERDKACRLCGATSNPSGRSLIIHHINGRRHYLIIDMANEEHNLVTLCNSCHMKVEQCITHGRTSSLPKWLRPTV